MARRDLRLKYQQQRVRSMSPLSQLHGQIESLLCQQDESGYTDRRHLNVLLSMVVALLASSAIGLNRWVPFLTTRAKYAASHQRRLSRWLHNPRINPIKWWSTFTRHWWSEWEAPVIVLALDSTVLWGRYCLIRLSLPYRGRAVPVTWRVLRQDTPSVGFADYRPLLVRLQHQLPPERSVRLLMDRAFYSQDLLRQLHQWGWHYRLRLKGNARVRGVRGRGQSLKHYAHQLARGEARYLRAVRLGKSTPSPTLSIALGRDAVTGHLWAIASDQPVTLHTFGDYAERFMIEEEFLDEKSNGYQLESTRLDSAPVLSRLCLVLALTTWVLVSQGQQVVERGRRREIDCHWWRGSSYGRLGWDWIRSVLLRGATFFATLQLGKPDDPEPAIASLATARQRSRYGCSVSSFSFSP